MIYSQVAFVLSTDVQFVQLDTNRDGLVKAEDIVEFSYQHLMNYM